MGASVVLEGPIERESAPRRDGTEAFATGRNGRGDLPQRSREPGAPITDNFIDRTTKRKHYGDFVTAIALFTPRLILAE